MRYRINSPKVIHQIFDTEVVIVNLESGTYYSVRGGGIDVWRYLETGAPAEQIAAAFPSNDEIAKFLAELETEQLIVRDDKASGVATILLEPKSIVPPTLEKFTDMRDLLLLDPIHELDESGWPKNRPPVEEK